MPRSILAVYLFCLPTIAALSGRAEDLAPLPPRIGPSGDTKRDAPPIERESRPILPPTLPGYELRVLDVKKEVRILANGVWTQASLPVFVYFPVRAQEATERTGRVRTAYEALRRLSREREWKAADLEKILSDLHAALGSAGTQP